MVQRNLSDAADCFGAYGMRLYGRILCKDALSKGARGASSEARGDQVVGRVDQSMTCEVIETEMSHNDLEPLFAKHEE